MKILFQNQFKNDDINSIGLEITEPIATTRRQVIVNNGYRGNNVQRAPTIIEDYEVDDFNDQRQDIGLPTYIKREQQPQPIVQDESQPFVIFLF